MASLSAAQADRLTPRILRGAWGALLLLALRRVLALCGGARTRAVVLGARALGARHLAEAALLTAQDRATPPRWMVGVDAAHAASMLALAGCSPRLRRDALASATTALALVALSLRERQGLAFTSPGGVVYPRRGAGRMGAHRE